MNDLINQGRGLADELTDQGLAVWADRVRRLADAIDTQRVELENRKGCHEEAIALAGSLGDQLRAAQTQGADKTIEILRLDGEMERLEVAHNDLLAAHNEQALRLAHAAERANRVEGNLAAIRAYHEPEGWALKAVINCLRGWMKERGKAPFYVDGEDLYQLEQWGSSLLQAHNDDRLALTNPARRSD